MRLGSAPSPTLLALNKCTLPLPALFYPVLYTVVVPPRVTIRPTTQTLRPGDVFQVSCEAFDPLTNQQLRVRWSRDRADMSPSANIEDGSLEIVSVTAPDAGLYRCTADNEAGANFGVAELVIFGHFRVIFSSVYTGWRKKRGQPISLQIF